MDEDNWKRRKIIRKHKEIFSSKKVMIPALWMKRALLNLFYYVPKHYSVIDVIHCFIHEIEI